EDHQVPKDERKPMAGYNAVGTDYFRTMKVPIVRGRAFTREDDERARPVAIVNELMAHRLWPDQDPIGKRFRLQSNLAQWLEVVGVSGPGKYQFIFEDPGPYLFTPIAQQYRPLRVLHIRTTAAPEAIAPAA